MIEYDCTARAGNRSKRSTSGLSRLAIDSGTSFSIAPWRWVAIVGVALAAGGGLFGLWIAANALLPGEAVQGYPSPESVIGFFGAVQLLDEQLFVFLNSLGSERWDGLWLFITHKFSWIPVYVALMYLVHRHYGLKNMLIIVGLIVVMITITDQLANLFKHGLERPRPCREEHLREIMRYVAQRCGRYGFFSAHAANSMAFAVFLGLLFRRIHKQLAILLIFWALIVGFSRIYVGVHYPLDTLTGLAIGALVGFLVYRLAKQRLELPHTASLHLAPDPIARQQAWREIVRDVADPEETEAIRLHLQRQHHYSPEQFRRAVEAQLGRAVGPATIGRPREPTERKVGT